MNMLASVARYTASARLLHSSANHQGRLSFLDELKHKIPRVPSGAELVAAAPEPSQKYLRLIRADKPTGTFLLFWPSAWAIALAAPAGSLPSLSTMALFGAGAFSMRAAGCVINDLWDRDFDRQVERTRSRPLASGELGTGQAVTLLAGLLSTSLAILLQLKYSSILVGASAMILVISYPLAKRYTDWPQAVLAPTMNWGTLIAWTHLLPVEEWPKVLPLFAATSLHTFIYDTIYAHQDKRDDADIGVRSSALRLGEKTKKVLAACTASMGVSLAMAGALQGQTWPFYAAAAATTAHVAWQTATVNINDPESCGAKFRSNAYLGAVLLFGIIVSNLLREKETGVVVKGDEIEGED